MILFLFGLFLLYFIIGSFVAGYSDTEWIDRHSCKGRPITALVVIFWPIIIILYIFNFIFNIYYKAGYKVYKKRRKNK